VRRNQRRGIASKKWDYWIEKIALVPAAGQDIAMAAGWTDGREDPTSWYPSI
jgi:hypothetical protein